MILILLIIVLVYGNSLQEQLVPCISYPVERDLLPHYTFSEENKPTVDGEFVYSDFAYFCPCCFCGHLSKPGLLNRLFDEDNWEVTHKLSSYLMDDALTNYYEFEAGDLPFWVVCQRCAQEDQYVPGTKCAMNMSDTTICFHQEIPIHKTLKCKTCERNVHLECSIIQPKKYIHNGSGIGSRLERTFLCFSCYDVEQEANTDSIVHTIFDYAAIPEGEILHSDAISNSILLEFPSPSMTHTDLLVLFQSIVGDKTSIKDSSSHHSSTVPDLLTVAQVCLFEIRGN